MVLCAATAMAQYRMLSNISYRTNPNNEYAENRCKLDVYYPENVKDVPVVVWFHGGGLEAGNKEIPAEIKNCGYAVVGVNYRLLPKATIDECIDDAAAAVAWTFQHAKEINGSKNKIYVAGHSAGGYLTCMLGYDKQWLAKYGVDADSICALFPFSAQVITHYNVRKKDGIGPLQPIIDKYAPLSHMRADAPPTYIISGDRNMELYGRYEEQAYYWRMLQLVGHKNAFLYEIQGFDHGSMAQPAFHILKQNLKK